MPKQSSDKIGKGLKQVGKVKNPRPKKQKGGCGCGGASEEMPNKQTIKELEEEKYKEIIAGGKEQNRGNSIKKSKKSNSKK